MRLSKLVGRPSKTEGTDLTIASNRLLVQGGFIRESAAGRYFMLPLGIAVHERIVSIVRRHMVGLGAQEVLMPTLHALELWRETNRTTTTGFELMKVKDRRGAEFALGGTAEEMAVDLVRKFNLSYRDLPFSIFQFSMKFRDEMRARGGLLRVREFVMKDAYSFGTEEQFGETYRAMGEAYKAIFNECGLKVDMVAADNGYIGGEYCHEFVVESEIGESRYFIDDKTGYAAHEDVAEFVVEDKNVGEAMSAMEIVTAERAKTMQAGTEFHKLPDWQQIKDVVFFDEATGRFIVAVIRGDLDVNETKLMQVAKAYDLRPATDAEIRDELESEPGFISPVGLRRKGKTSDRAIVVVGDPSLRTVRNAFGGANRKHKDAINVNIDRDYTLDVEGDIALAQPGFTSPEGGTLTEKRGIEVGNIFQLGYHYTNLMSGAEYTDVEGSRKRYYMGCYGIGIGRTMAAIVESHNDERGIQWPASVAPAAAYLVRLGDDPEVHAQAEELYSRLKKAGVEMIYDDRDESAGHKFADADLIGLPVRLTVSKKTLAAGAVEWKERTKEAAELVPANTVLDRLVHKA